MAPNLTAQEVNEAREHDRMAGRVKSLAWTFGGVHKSDEHKNASSKSSDLVPHEYAEEDRQRLRANYLAWMFGGVHINNAHEDWDNLSSTDKEALRAKLAEGQQRSDEQMDKLFQGVRVKWCFVETGRGVESVQVIEDSGSANNWISRIQIERFGLSAKRGPGITGMTLTGEKFFSEKYVDVPWIGKGSRQGTDRFYVAPEKTPIDMLVGDSFTTKYPGVFMDREPTPTPQLLTLQSKVKADEQLQIEAERTRAEEQADMLRRRKRANRLPASPAHDGTRSTISSGQATLESNTSRKRTSK